MREQLLLSLVSPQNNGVHFLTPSATDRKLSQGIVHSILAQYDIQRVRARRLGFAVESFQTQLQPDPLEGIMVHVADIFSESPDHLYQQLSYAFSIPEYYGYTIDTLSLFLTDLTWLQKKHHVLLLNIPSSSTMLPPFHSLWALLNQVAQYWQTQGAAFLIFVLQGTSPHQLETPRI